MMWRDVDVDDIDCGEGAALAGLLREEAVRERPVFSPALHSRFLRALAVAGDEPVLPSQRVGRASSTVVRRHRGLNAVFSRAVAATAIAALVGLIRLPPTQWAGPAAARSPGSSAGDQSMVPLAEAAADPGLIERLPMFDEVDRELRSGVVLLAASLLDLPSVPDIGEFDPIVFLGADPPP